MKTDLENLKDFIFKKIICYNKKTFFHLAQFAESGENPILMANALPKVFA